MEETCSSTSPGSLVIVHLSPGPRGRDWRFKLPKMHVVDCGKHVHCWSSSRPNDLGHYFRVETPLCFYGPVRPRKAVHYHV